MLPSGAAQASSPHAPILISGDADLCDDEDGDGVVGQDDGITNCSTADGSPKRPFVVAGWSIERTSATGLEGCQGADDCLAACNAPATMALVAICDTDLHVRLERLTLSMPFVAGATTDGTAPVVQDYVAVHLLDARNVTLSQSTLRAAGIAVLSDGSLARPGSVILEALHVSALDASAQTSSAVAAAAAAPLLGLRQSAAVLERVTVVAGQRPVGVDFNHSGPGLLRLDLRSAAISGTSEKALRLRHANATLHDLKVEASGLPGYRAVTAKQENSASPDARSAALDLVASDVDLANSSIDFRGAGIEVDARSRLHAQSTRFTSDQTAAAAVVFRAGNDRPCASRIMYNEFIEPTTIRNDDICRIPALSSYWGQQPPEGRMDGGFVYLPVLPSSLDKLPTISVRTPRDGESAFDTAIVEGMAGSRDGSPLRTVAATLREDDWNHAIEGPAAATWSLSVPIEGSPGQAVQIWLRACSESSCGVPERLDLLVGQEPRPPIGILEASPRVAWPGHVVTFDASASYSPTGLSIVGYTYDFGDGTVLGPVPEPLAIHRFAAAQVYHASLTVRDSAGVESANVAGVAINVEDPAAGKDAGGGLMRAIPGPGPLLVAAGIVATVWGCRRRG